MVTYNLQIVNEWTEIFFLYLFSNNAMICLSYYFSYYFTITPYLLIRFLNILRVYFYRSLGNNKRLLQNIFHISPRPIAALQLRCRAWNGSLGLIPGTIWKILCHNLFITYFTLTFLKYWLLYGRKDLWTDKLRK